MGFDGWVSPRTQITDELQWARAMQAIKMRFQNDGNFREFTWDDQYNQYNQQYKNKRLSDTDILGVLLSESGNFQKWCKDTFHIISKPSCWYPSSNMLQQYKITSLEEFSNYEKSERNYLEELQTDPDDYDYGVQKEQVLTCANLHRSLNDMSEIERGHIFKLVEEKRFGVRIDPPTMFEFTVGEHPRLPVFARHFRRCASKISGCGEEADDYLTIIHEILSHYFPGNIGYFYDDCEDYAGPPGINQNETKAEKRHFYDTWRVMPTIEIGTMTSHFHMDFVEKLSASVVMPSDRREVLGSLVMQQNKQSTKMKKRPVAVDAFVPVVEEKKQCIICFERQYNTVLDPCGHMWTCFECATQIKDTNQPCPACRKEVKKILRVYTPE